MYDIRTDQGEKVIIRTGAIRLPWREQDPLLYQRSESWHMPIAEKRILYGIYEKGQAIRREQILRKLKRAYKLNCSEK